MRDHNDSTRPEAAPSDSAGDVRKILAYAVKIEMAWRKEPVPAAATDRRPLLSTIETGYEPNEATYAAAVQLLLEEDCVPFAQKTVIQNRMALSAYRDAGVEPGELVNYILSR